MEAATPKTRPAADNLWRLQPLRVLVSGQDRHFVRVTAFLLALHGYDVAEAVLGDAARVAARHRSDVVLLESDSRTLAARTVTQIGALATAPAVVLATVDGSTLWTGQQAVRKWTPLDDLTEALESASLRRSELQNGHPR